MIEVAPDGTILYGNSFMVNLFWLQDQWIHFETMKTEIPFSFRIPEKLKTKLDEAKEKSRRSLNAEMLVRIEESFRPPLSGYSDGELIAELMRRYERGSIHIRIGNPDRDT